MPRGGKREGAGRPKNPVPSRWIGMRLHPDEVEHLNTIDPSVSEAIHQVIKRDKDRAKKGQGK